MAQIKNLIISNAPLKIVSCILGYTFWFILGHSQTIKTELTVPICFYGANPKMQIEAPETVHIELSGKRTIMQTVDLSNLAIHIDVRDLVEGSQPIEITQEKMFLPESIKLIHYSPAQIVVAVHTHKEPDGQLTLEQA